MKGEQAIRIQHTHCTNTQRERERERVRHSWRKREQDRERERERERSKSSHCGEEAVVGEDGSQGEVSSIKSQTDGGYKSQVAQRQQINCYQLLFLR